VLAADLGPGPKDGPLKIGGTDSCPRDKDLGPPAAAPVAPADDWIEVVSAKDLAFKQVGAKDAPPVKPLFSIADQKYAVYWNTEKKS